jgi:hypothetical protein
VLSAEQGRALDGVEWDQCECYAEWCGLRNGVVAEGGEVGSLSAALLCGYQGRALGGMRRDAVRCHACRGMQNSVVAEGCGRGRVGEAAVGYVGRLLGGVGWDEVRALCLVAWSARQCVAERGCTGQSRESRCGVPRQGVTCAPLPKGFSAGAEGSCWVAWSAQHCM